VTKEFLMRKSHVHLSMTQNHDSECTIFCKIYDLALVFVKVHKNWSNTLGRSVNGILCAINLTLRTTVSLWDMPRLSQLMTHLLHRRVPGSIRSRHMKFVAKGHSVIIQFLVGIGVGW
jgi:hypothetical protein